LGLFWGLLLLAELLLLAQHPFFNGPVNELGPPQSKHLFSDLLHPVQKLGAHSEADLFSVAFFGHEQHDGGVYHIDANNSSVHIANDLICNVVTCIMPRSGPPCPLFGQVEAATRRVPQGAEERCVMRKRKKANVSGAWFFKTHAITFQVVLAEVPLHSDGFRCMCRVDPENKVILISSDVPASVRIALVGKALALIWRKELAVNGKLPDAEYGAAPGPAMAISHVDGPDGVPLMLIDGPAFVPLRRGIKSAAKAVTRRSTGTEPFRRPCVGPRV